VLHATAAVEQDSDLTSDLARQLGHRPREVVRDETVRLQTASPESLEGFHLARLEAARVAVDLDGVCSCGGTIRSRRGTRIGAHEPRGRHDARVGDVAVGGQASRVHRSE
jgi:hypothetical protein